MSLQIPSSRHHSVVEELTLSADASGTALNSKFKGKYIYQCKIKASSDTSVTLTLNDEDGAQLGTMTGDYTTAGFMTLAAYRYMTGIPTYTLSGLGGGTVTVKIVAVN